MSAALPLDEAISKALLAEIARHGGTRAYPARAVLINEGDDGDSLFVVLAGRVKVYASSAEGRDVVLGELGPGEYFGELSIDGGPRSVSVMTLEPCTCCVVPGAQLRQFLADYPDFALHLAVKLCRLVRRLTEQVKGLALHNVQDRIVRLLTDLSEPAGDERVVARRLTQQDIADRVGSSREMVNRVVKELAPGGWLALREGRYVIRRELPPSR